MCTSVVLLHCYLTVLECADASGIMDKGLAIDRA